MCARACVRVRVCLRVCARMDVRASVCARACACECVRACMGESDIGRKRCEKVRFIDRESAPAQWRFIPKIQRRDTLYSVEYNVEYNVESRVPQAADPRHT